MGNAASKMQSDTSTETPSSMADAPGNTKPSRPPSFGLLGLPNEILLEIVSLLPHEHISCRTRAVGSGAQKQFDSENLCIVRFTCKRFAAIGDLWLGTNLTSIYLGVSPRSLRTFEAISNHPQYNKTIREVVYVGCRFSDSLRRWDDYFQEAKEWYME